MFRSLYVRVTLGILAGVLIFFIFLRSGVFAGFAEAGRLVLGPLVRVVVSLPNYQDESDENLEERVKNFNDQYFDKMVDAAAFSMIKEENEMLRAILSLSSTTPLLSARVQAEKIIDEIDPLGSAFVVNRGEKDGVKVGLPVVARGGILAGIVVSVNERTAVVRRLTDSSSRVAASIMNKDRSLGLIEGGFGLSLRLNWIPQNEEVNVGDVVVTSGLQPLVPRGLVVGTVEALEREPYRAFQRAIIAPAIRRDDLVLVSILVGVSYESI